MATIEKRGTGDGVTYRAKIRIKGHSAQSATFERLTDARPLGAVHRGRDPRAAVLQD
jgi:hypothetical protein